jgi:histone deacetylase complex regulatory component SIN3
MNNYENAMEDFEDAKNELDSACDEVKRVYDEVKKAYDEAGKNREKWEAVWELIAWLKPNSPSSILHSAYGSEELRGKEALELLEKIWKTYDKHSWMD